MFRQVYTHVQSTTANCSVPQDLIEELQIRYNDAQPWKRIMTSVHYLLYQTIDF